MKKKLLILALQLLAINLIAQSNQELNWKEHIIKLESCHPDEDLKDLSGLGKAIGGSKVIGLGETTHGTNEIFTMKHRIIKYLIKEKGFNIIAFESNKPETELINQYIQGGNGDPKELLKGIYFWTWNTQEILDLIIWLRAYNMANDEKIQFLGIDMQYNKQAIKNLKTYYSSNAAIINQLLEIETLYKQNKRSKLNYKHLDVLIKNLSEKINRHLTNNEDVEKIAFVKENLKVISQSAHMDKTQSTVYRDESMAGYVKDYLEKSANNKVIVWAHNMHISKDEFWKMGFHLQKQFKSDYYSIGFSLSKGTFIAKDYQNKIMRNNKLSENPKKSIEYQFDKLGIPLFFIDTDFLKLDKWFLSKRKFKDIGAALWGSQFIKVKIITSYDALIHIENSTASKILE